MGRIITGSLLVICILKITVSLGFPTTMKSKVEEEIMQRFHQTTRAITRQALHLSEKQRIPFKAQQLLGKLERHYLPIVTSQIKMQTENISDQQRITEIIDSLTVSYIRMLRLDRFFSSNTHLIHKRDDEEFPNYLDTVYGGFGGK